MLKYNCLSIEFFLANAFSTQHLHTFWLHSLIAFYKHTGLLHTKITNWKIIVNKYLPLQFPPEMPCIY